MNLNEIDRMRLTAGWQPGAWIGVAGRAFGPVAQWSEGEDGEAVVESLPVQWLIALWRPQSLEQPMLPRLPVVVQLTPRQDDRAVIELLRHVPAAERMWLADIDVDWALLAEIVMLTDRALQPWQHRELARFIIAEREAIARRIASSYDDPELGADSCPTIPAPL